ncbi:MAG: hypothetical protein JNK14_12415 [Chitinophagaceae bacterium]|nr:hypothetical protein [Chitinophagaceae bacterium]
MVKYILSTGTGVILCSIISTRQFTVTADPAETKFTFDKIVYADPPVNDKPRFGLPEEGDVAAHHTNEIKLYSGTVKRHKLHGDWQSWYSNQQLCDSGSFFKGLPVGEWKHWNSSGQLIAIRHYDASKFFRIQNEFTRSGPKQVVYPLTKLYRKNRRQANYYMHASYSFSFDDHHPHHFSLQQAVQNNITPGNSYRPLFDECLHHGLYMNFYSNGAVKDSGYYKNGLKDGIWIHREESGSYVTGVYKNSLKTGDWKQYDAKGKLQYFIFYDKKGREEWRKRIGR